ncbi:helix-turn-helix domain-containing protein [Microbacterium hominis]|uniref:helix-turn-helix domain-containing protein n=1 Tax=Microbacterium hominis TaxID=162426 RepID=UPI003B831181
MTCAYETSSPPSVGVAASTGFASVRAIPQSQVEATTVPEILCATRALAGLTVREIAPMIGVSHGTISAWERGQGEPSVTQPLRWASATKQPAQQLLDGLSSSVVHPLGLEPRTH